MRQIDDALWIGHAGDARDPQRLFAEDFQAVVDLAWNEAPASPFPRELLYLRIPLVDGSENEPARLRLAIHTVVQLLGEDVKTLVCCSAGLSRSPAIASAALSLFKKTSFESVLAGVASKGPCEAHPGFVQSVSDALAQTS